MQTLKGKGGQIKKGTRLVKRGFGSAVAIWLLLIGILYNFFLISLKFTLEAPKKNSSLGEDTDEVQHNLRHFAC